MIIIKPRQTYQCSIQKQGNGLQQHQRPSKSCGYYKRDKIHRRNYEKVKKLRGTIDNTIKSQSDPIGKVANFSKKTFSKEIFQLLNKYPLFEHQKYKISTR